jgi:mevalonate kinase
MMIVTTLTSYSTTKQLREKVSSVLAETDRKIDPRLEDITDNLSQKIIKALTC